MHAAAGRQLATTAAAAADYHRPAGWRFTRTPGAAPSLIRSACCLFEQCAGAMATEPAEGVRIRTISFFIGNETIGHDEVAAAAAFLRKAKGAFEAAGVFPLPPAPPPLPPA